MYEPEIWHRHFFEKAADPADEIICRKKGQIVDANDGGGQCGRRDTRVKRKRDGENIGEANAVEQMKSNQPADCNFLSRIRRDGCADGERNEAGYSDKTSNAEFRDLGRLREFFRPKPPE